MRKLLETAIKNREAASQKIVSPGGKYLLPPQNKYIFISVMYKLTQPGKKTPGGRFTVPMTASGRQRSEGSQSLAPPRQRQLPKPGDQLTTHHIVARFYNKLTFLLQDNSSTFRYSHSTTTANGLPQISK
jgi:hypothetical protein